ncbi:MAG: tetratricopeptide repeat protein [Bacteroidota bacterium]
MPEKPQNFWQELKRRKVFRVITMYAAAAYVIIELSNNIVEPLRLPEWVPTLIIVLLVTGFPFAVIFSWIFDITPKGIQKTKPAKISGRKEPVSKSAKRKLKVSDIVIAVLLIAVIILVYPKIFKPDKLQELSSEDEVTIAVMPFQNMTGDTTWNIWQEGIQNELISSLTNTQELKVRQTETINNFLRGKDPVNYASLTPSMARDISQKLDANIFIYGTIKQAGENIRLNARLVDSKTDEIFRSFEIDGEAREEMIFQLIDSLKRKVGNFLVINKLLSGISNQEYYDDYGYSNSPEAYRYFIYGANAFVERDYPRARSWFNQALEVDSSFFFPAIYTAASYGNQGLYEEAKKWSLKIYSKKDLMPIELKLLAEWLYANYYETPVDEIRHIKQSLEIDEKLTNQRYLLGLCYNHTNQYDKAIAEFEKLFEVFDEGGLKPPWVFNYTNLGRAYHNAGEYKKEKKLYKKAEKDFPGDYLLLYRQAVLALSTGKTKAAGEYIDEYVSALEERSYSGAAIASSLGSVYLEAGMLQKAEEKYREALSLQPESSTRMNSLAYILIDNDINIEEGLELAAKALEIEPDNYLFLDTKGWGLYKQGKYEEALGNLERSWELKPVYDHDVYLHLEAAKKAVDAGNNEY